MKKSEIFSNEELGIRSEEFWCFSHQKGAGTSAPSNATEVASPIIKALQSNAYQNYSLFTTHYSLVAVQYSPICIPTQVHENEERAA